MAPPSPGLRTWRTTAHVSLFSIYNHVLPKKTKKKNCFLFIKKYVVGLVIHISINFIELLMGRTDKETGPIKNIKELDPSHMPKHKGSSRGLGSPILRSR